MTKKFAFFSALAICICLGVPIAFEWWPQGTEVAPMPSTHVEWSEVNPSGMLLITPFKSDSLGKHLTFVVPPGSILLIPRVLPGPPPERKLTES